MVIIDIVVSLLVACLSGMGVGGGGLLVIYLSLVGTVDQLAAQGINLLFFICASGAALLLNLKKRKFDFKRMVILSLSGVVFAILGAMVARRIDVGVLKKLFGGFLVLSGFLGVFKRE